MIKEKDYCVVLIKDFEDRLKISLPENQNYDCIEIDMESSISDEEFLEKTKKYNKFIFVLEIASRKAFSFLKYILRLNEKECVVITNIPFLIEGLNRRQRVAEALEYLLYERVNIEIIKCDVILKRFDKKTLFKTVIEACEDEFVYAINETVKN